MKALPRLPLSQIQERLRGMKECQTVTFHLQKGLILYVRSEGGHPEHANFQAWIPSLDGKNNLCTYTGETQGLMGLIANYRKYTPPSRQRTA